MKSWKNSFPHWKIERRDNSHHERSIKLTNSLKLANREWTKYDTFYSPSLLVVKTFFSFDIDLDTEMKLFWLYDETGNYCRKKKHIIWDWNCRERLQTRSNVFIHREHVWLFYPEHILIVSTKSLINDRLFSERGIKRPIFMIESHFLISMKKCTHTVHSAAQKHNSSKSRKCLTKISKIRSNIKENSKNYIWLMIYWLLPFSSGDTRTNKKFEKHFTTIFIPKIMTNRIKNSLNQFLISHE